MFSTVGTIGVASGIITPVESITSTIGVVIPVLSMIILPDSDCWVFSIAGTIGVASGIITPVESIISTIGDTDPVLSDIVVSLEPVFVSIIVVVPVLYWFIILAGVSDIE